MDTQNARLDELAKKVDAIYESVEKTRKYLWWTMVVTLALFILPLIGLLFVIPSFLQNYVGGIDSLTNY